MEYLSHRRDASKYAVECIGPISGPFINSSYQFRRRSNAFQLYRGKRCYLSVTDYYFGVNLRRQDLKTVTSVSLTQF